MVYSENNRTSISYENSPVRTIFRDPYAGNVNFQNPLPSYLHDLTENHQLQTREDLANFGYSYPRNFQNCHSTRQAFGGDFNSFRSHNWISSGARKYQDINKSRSRFIQLAEISSRPAFQSIEALVSVIADISTMLDSTYFAIINSFQAILGVAANFWHLRRVFSQFGETFFLCHKFISIYRKVFFWLKISSENPSDFHQTLKTAFGEAFVSNSDPEILENKKSIWAAFAFLTFVCTSPYLLLKMTGALTHFEEETSRNPEKWIKPMKASALYSYEARNPTQLTIQENQLVLLAPKEIQSMNHLLSTGWALASVDGKFSGLVPINYLKNPLLKSYQS